VNAAVYIFNRLTTRTIPSTPYEGWYKKIPDFLILEYKAAKLMSTSKLKEGRHWIPRALSAFFYGYCNNQKAYIPWNAAASQI
jgi:hypothetical protein